MPLNNITVGIVLVILLAFVGLGWYADHLHSQNATLTTERDAASALAIDNAAAVIKEHESADNTLKVVTADRDAAMVRLKTLGQKRKEIADAPAADDGVVAPVLRGALDSLQPGAAAQDSH